MKRKLLWLLPVFSVASFTTALAQDYEHLTVSSGFNADVIANGVGSASTSTTLAVDDANYNFMAANFQATAAATPPAYALPVSGLINSAPSPGLSFQLADYSGNNALRIATANASGTLTFTNQVSASKIYLLATTGSGTATITGTITFTDNSTQPITSSVIPDWFFSNALPVAASGFGRVNRVTNVMENPAGDPRLYQLAINILPANQPKQIASITITKTSTALGILNIFAVTAEELGTCPSPINVTATSTANSGIITWDAPVILPATGYEYYYSTSLTPPTVSTTPSGSVAVGTNTVTIPSLITGQQYYVWVRSNCSDTDKGPWVMTSFTTGQLTVTYTAGDISTDYNETPTVTSVTGCPGTLSVTVPAGYEVASVSTAYTMTTASNGWKSEQRSLLVCTTTNTTEAQVSLGEGGTGGTMAYSRSGLDIADGATGTVNFELRAWRTYGNEDLGCTVTHNKVDNNSWTVTVTYQEVCTPPLPPVAAPQEVCAMSPVSGLVATGADGATFNWYTSASGGSPLSATASVTAGTYYVSQTVNNCESERTLVVVTINTVPNPTADVNQAFCTGATVADLEAEGEAGGTIIWANTAAGIPLAPDTALTTGNYYVFQQLDGCQTAGTPISVTINDPQLPTADLAQTLCYGATVAQLSAEGSATGTLQWSATEGGAILSATDELEEGTYYVREVIGECESPWFEVDVYINPEVALVLTETNQTLCYGSTVADLYAIGANTGIIQWAETEGGTVLGVTAELEAGSYFVRQIIGSGCESAWTEVAVFINAEVPVVLTEPNQEFCGGGTVAELYAEGADTGVIEWAQTEGGATLTIDVELEPGNYYVRQIVGECESGWTQVAVTINDIPNMPAGDEAQEFTSGETVADLEITTPTGTEINWYMYNDIGMLISIEPTTVLEDGETYYVSQSLGDCESEMLAITVDEALATIGFTNTNLKVYPNPATDVLTISHKEPIDSVSLYNVLGQKVFTAKGSSLTLQTDISRLSAGTYIAEINISGGETASVKIVKK